MATVSTYWCLPEEEADLLHYLTKWDVYSYFSDAIPNIFDVKPVPIKTLIEERNPSQLYFAPKQFLSQDDICCRNSVDGIHLFGVSPMQSQTIAYRRPFFHENGALGKSSLSAYWKYPNVTATDFIEKNPDFIKWAKGVFKWSRKYAPERLMLNGYAYPATTKVKQLVDRNKLVLAF
jgi:hypothetical protein